MKSTTTICIVCGAQVRRVGGSRVAAVQLDSSGLCGLAAPWLLDAPLWAWGAWLLWWRATVSGDSPQFSALTAASAPRAYGRQRAHLRQRDRLRAVHCHHNAGRRAGRWPLAQVLPWLAVGREIAFWFLLPLWRAGC